MLHHAELLQAQQAKDESETETHDRSRDVVSSGKLACALTTSSGEIRLVPMGIGLNHHQLTFSGLCIAC